MQKVVVEIISVTYAKHGVCFYYTILHVSVIAPVVVNTLQTKLE